MRKHDRPTEREALNAALDEFLDQWWERELLSDVLYWLRRSVEAQDHDPACCCHDYTSARLHVAVKALRAWRQLTRRAVPDEEAGLLEQLDAQLSDEARERVLVALDEKLN